MWSDRYNYYNIQSDEHFSQKLEKEAVIKALQETNCFKRKNHQCFTNAEGFPWIDMILVETEDRSFASSDKEDLFVNLIAIVCLKRQHMDQQIYLKTFLQIAEKLKWKLYLEDDDNGNENIEIKRR
jgi:hypothetical protein